MNRQAISAVVTLLAAAGPVLADSAPDHAPVGKPWVAIVVAFAMLGGIILLSVMSSKRGRRD